MLRFVTTAIFFTVLATSSLAAQSVTDPSVSAHVLSNKVAIGEFGTFIVEVKNGDAQMPARIDTQGLEIISSGPHFSQMIVNGVRTSKNSYYYRFRGNSPGKFTIPPLTVEVRGQQFTTQAIAVEVYERKLDDVTRDATKPFFAKLELSKDTFYVNELVPFSLTAYVRGRNAISEVVSPRLENESFVFKGFREVRTEGGELGGSNSYFSSAVVPSNLFALKAGSHRLGPAQIGVRVLDSSSGFGLSAFFQRSITREMTTNTVNVTVKPLPNGEPISFTGGVGSFEMTATPSTKTVSLGDPISMNFEIKGVGNLRTMGAPVFSSPQKGIWKTYEASKTLDDENDSDGFKEGKATFTMVIIPEAKVSRIPSFELSYFDPEEETYVTRKTGPIPISVVEGARTSAPTVVKFPDASSDGGSAVTTAAQSPAPQFNGMLHIRTDAPDWIAAADIGKRGPFYLAVQVVFSILFFTVVGYGIMVMAREGRFQRQSGGHPETFAQALKQLPGNASTKREFFMAVNTALDLWKTEHPHPSKELASVVERIKERSDTVLYSGTLSTEEPVGPAEVSEFQTILNKLPRR